MKKKLGVLHSNSPKAVIRDFKSWYKELDYHKITKYWYEIGYFGL